MLLAVTLTAVGFAYDAGSGDKELSMVFAATYVLGCIFAVLAVRQSAIFTAVIQPPLILFVAVPSAYFLFHGGQLGGIKDVAINCGYPLIERFPLMFFTSAAVLLIGMGRWYYGMSSRRGAARAATEDAKEKTSSRVSSVTSKVSSLLKGEPAELDEEAVDTKESPRRKHTIERPTRAAKSAQAPAGTPRTAKRATPSRSRHARPPETEIIEPVAERPRRPRTSRQREQPPVPPAEPRRRPRTSSTPNRARPRRLPTGEPATSAPSDGAALMIIRRKNHTSATEMGRITRYRGCATAAVPTRATTARSTGAGRARHAAAGKPKAGSTTSNPERS